MIVLRSMQQAPASGHPLPSRLPTASASGATSAKPAERCVSRHRSCLRATETVPQRQKVLAPADGGLPRPPTGHRFADRTCVKHATVHALLAAGHSRRSIQRHLGMTYRTVQRLADAATAAAMEPSMPTALDGGHGPLADAADLEVRWLRQRSFRRRRRRLHVYSGTRSRSQCRTQRRVGRKCHRTAGGPGRAGPDVRQEGAATASRSPAAWLSVVRSGTTGCGWTDQTRTGRRRG